LALVAALLVGFLWNFWRILKIKYIALFQVLFTLVMFVFLALAVGLAG
jgi:hypothetical protein